MVFGTRRPLHNARALVTGASSGIGRELALALGAEGCQLLVTGRREQRLRELCDTLRASGRTAHWLAVDLAAPDAPRQLIAAAQQQLGGLDLLVNNAGVGAIGPFAEASPERLAHLLQVNFLAVAELTRHALPLLAEGRRPLVVNVGSILGHFALPNYSEYCASKFALRGWSDALRGELRPRGIGVLLVSPGSTESEFFDNLAEDRGGRSLRPSRLVPASEVARQTIRAIQRGRREIIPSSWGRLMVWAHRMAPGVVQRLIAAAS